MHISGRLAFHLGEEFFEAITDADAIALESNPIIWLDEIFNSPYASDYLGTYAFRDQVYKGFYREAFKLDIPDNLSLGKALSKDHYLTNWMLYRENKSQSDFQEETFLDLFIYQAGMKQNKAVYSLENFSQTTHLSKLGRLPDPEEKITAAWFDEMTEERNPRFLVQEAYRNKDVFLLDSLHSQINSDQFIKYMLEVRNEIMTEKIDSFINHENISLFIGIGAAHLGGHYGVIEFLREKGYTVEPMATTITDQAKSVKNNFDIQQTQITFENTFTSDLFSVKVPDKLYETPSSSENQRQFFSPELTNGSYFSVKQISTYSYFSSIKQSDYVLKIDSILFENIPGNIIRKTPITKSGFQGLDIINQTASGNHQHYQIFFTPLNIFIFKMGAKKDFVLKHGDSFFESIDLKPVNKEAVWLEVSSSKNDFKIKLPEYYHVKNNSKVTSLYGHTEIEAFDPSTTSYFFVKRTSLHDIDFIEEDSYELNRLAEQFFKSIDIDSFKIEIPDTSFSPFCTAKAKNLKGEFMHIKIVINGPYYYLLASISEKDKVIPDFFDSFKTGDFNYTFPFETKTDSTLMFTVNSNYLYPTPYEDKFEKAKAISDENGQVEKVDHSYKGYSESRTYYSENFERIYVKMRKFHDYHEYANIDSLWQRETRKMQTENGFILKYKNQTQENDLHYLTLEFTDTNTSRVILAKKILQHGQLYTLSTNIDTSGRKSAFVSNFFDSFAPFETKVGNSIFEDKSKLFLNNIYSSDSLTKAQALESVKRYIRFDNADFDPLKKVILDYPFTNEQIDTKSQLISDLGRIHHEDLTYFLADLYGKFEDTALYQIAVLQALTSQNTKQSHQLFLDLIEQDIPLPDQLWEIRALYRPLYDSLELASEVFPDLINYTFINAYKKETYRLLADLTSAQQIKAKVYKKNYKQILREAKIELKSQISAEQSALGQKPSKFQYDSYKNKGNGLLVNYCKILLPFYNKSEVFDFFAKLNKVQDFRVQTLINIEKTKYNIPINDSVWVYLANDLVNRSFLYEMLEENDRLDLFPKTYLEQKTIVESILYSSGFNADKDSLIFIAKRQIDVLNQTGYIYFFKSKRQYEDEWSLDYIGLQPINNQDINTSPYWIEKGVKIEKFKEIEEILEEEIESIKLEGHKRATSSSKFGEYSWYY